jgi:predicted dehydrogenase
MTLYENVADVLAGRAAPLITAEEALDTARLLDAAFQSAATGEVVRMGQ